MFELFRKKHGISPTIEPSPVQGGWRIDKSLLTGERHPCETNNVQSVRSSRNGSRDGSKNGVLVSVLGAKGGVGCTTFAINLASALSTQQVDTTLVDVNMQQPDVSLFLGKAPVHSLSGLMRRPLMDAGVFEACCERRSFSSAAISFLSPPLDLETSLDSDTTELPEVLNRARVFTSALILDLPKVLDSTWVGLIDSTDHLILIAEPGLASIAASKRWLSILEQLAFPVARMTVVLNRSGGKLNSLEDEAEDLFRNYRCWKLPSAYVSLEQSAITAEPLVFREPRHRYSKTAQDVAEFIKDNVDRRLS
ncbi:MAG: P-loop NTPase [Cyanobacteria bacterium]|nr:P-loop NTPase [Cyanobacteriota bacterium]